MTREAVPLENTARSAHCRALLPWRASSGGVRDRGAAKCVFPLGSGRRCPRGAPAWMGGRQVPADHGAEQSDRGGYY